MMLLLELFGGGDDVMAQMRQNALDVITPFLAQDVPFITVNQVIDGLRHNDNMGIAVDRSLVMELLDPDQIKAVDRIEGNRIYLTQPEDATRQVDAEDKQNDQDTVQKMAQDQAAKQIQTPNPTTPPQN